MIFEPFLHRFLSYKTMYSLPKYDHAKCYESVRKKLNRGTFFSLIYVPRFAHQQYAWNGYFLLSARKKKSLIMSDYQGFAWFFFCFQWSAWFMNLAVYSPINQYLWSYKLCTCHVLVLKNCPLLSSTCLLISWVQKYAFFLNYANHW